MEVTGPFVVSKKNKNPGPGKYSLNSTLNKLSYTLGSKHSKDNR